MAPIRQILSASLLLGLASTSDALAIESRAANTPKGAILVPMVRDDTDLIAYYAKFEVGTPPQKEYLKVDTGSPTYSFINPNNTQCAGGACKKYGTFSNTTSSTSKFVAPSFSDFLGAVGQGDFLSDTVTIGGVTAKNLTFGYVDVYANPSHQFPPIASIAGFSTNCYGLGPECGNAGAYLMQGLKNKSVIDRQSVSMYLGPDIWNTTAAQMILGGYYDSSKFAGPRVTVAMTDPFNQITSNGQTNSVNVTRLTVTQKDNSKTSQAYNNSGSGEPVLIDSGAPTIFLPQTLANAVLKAFGNASKSNGGIVPAYVVDCKYQTEYSGTFTAEFEGGASVTVPLSDWVTKFKDGTCATYVFAIGDGPQLRSFGDPWLRSVYTIFDQEAKRLTMGPVKHTKSVTYEKIPSGGFPVTKGKGYSSKGY